MMCCFCPWGLPEYKLHAQHKEGIYSHQLQLQERRVHQKRYLATGFTFLHFEYEQECVN